ncbi:MAG TPA: ABC-three component system middle component 8 [Candidatus Deferrimicrobium sp.]|nr:ABC-three component system middle component 8 [Candidatus Deferrimicrobium sp.]
MLKPNKHLDPRFSVIHVGGLILKTLKDNGILTFDELLSILMGKIDVKVKEVFLPSLSFLFLLGKIQYHQQIDSFELTT